MLLPEAYLYFVIVANQEKDLYINNLFISIYVNCLFWQIFNEIVEYPYLYRNKDDL